jgi:hypothetical protein
MIKKVVIYIIILCSVFLNAQVEHSDRIDSLLNDGPYIFIEQGHLLEKRIVNGLIQEKKLELNAFQTKFKSEASEFKGVEHIVALSDIHGQFDLAIKILKNNKVIDDHLNWIFGSGHFVIVGDVFDRGPKVTETLWFIYNLEMQAKASGGKVHFLLGNHEFMVLHNDLRYLHKKYEKASVLLETRYDLLFSDTTILGAWLRSKSTLVKINDNVFVHGGISLDFLSEKFNIKTINKVMRASLNREKSEMKTTPFYKRYYGKNGPIWYRGYFNESLNDDDIKTILNQIHANHIVVGHCSQTEVLQLYNQKIFAVDSSIKNGAYGEVLFIDVQSYARGTMQGEKIKF